jgi:hypothetical protein
MHAFTRWMLVGLAAGLGSCAAVVPHTLQTPWVEKRGQTELALQTGLHGTGLQGAHQLTDHVTVLGGLHQRVRNKRGYWAYTGEAGLGYSWPRQHRQTWSLYGGLGYGAGQSSGSFCPDLCDLSVSDRVRYGYAFVQPTFRWIIDPAFGLSVGVKVMAFDFLQWRQTSYSLRGYYADTAATAMMPTVKNEPGFGGVAVQPGMNMFLRLSPHFRLNFNSSIFLPLQRRFPSAMPLAFGLGLQYYFGGPAVAEEAR